MKNFAEKTKGFDGNTPLFIDENQELFKVERAVRSVLIAEGKLCLYKDRLSFIVTKGRDAGNTINFPFETIIEMSCFAMMRIIFYTKESELFEINSKYPRSALKYLDLFTEIKPKKE